MKYIFALWLLLNTAEVFSQAKFKFENKIQKFEKVKAGEVLSFDFFYVNEGDKPIIIHDIKVTCPCTKFSYPKAPIMPGERNKIAVTFDTKGKIGYQDRIMEVYSNAEKSPQKIRFKGIVDHKK